MTYSLMVSPASAASDFARLQSVMGILWTLTD